MSCSYVFFPRTECLGSMFKNAQDCKLKDNSKRPISNPSNGTSHRKPVEDMHLQTVLAGRLAATHRRCSIARIQAGGSFGLCRIFPRCVAGSEATGPSIFVDIPPARKPTSQPTAVPVVHSPAYFLQLQDENLVCLTSLQF